MITLSEALRLCDIQEEMVYFLTEDSRHNDIAIWSTKLRNHFDLKTIQVTKIRPHFERFGPDFLGMCFTVKGLTRKQLFEAGGL